eukprot:scaffold3578_cov112-Isochrysis_galbana.AAC.2
MPPPSNFTNSPTLQLSKRAAGASAIHRSYSLWTRLRDSASPWTYMQHHSQRLSRAAVMASWQMPKPFARK